MNWGKGITIGMAVFIGFILFMVITLMNHRADLVSEDYYQQELNYDQQYNALTNYAGSKERIAVRTDSVMLRFELPELLSTDSVHLQLRRPDNKALDISIDLPAHRVIVIPLVRLRSGQYEASIRGRMAGRPYLFQERVIIP